VRVERSAPVQTPAEDPTTIEKDPRWALVQRVAGSAAFLKSKRLREFLLFVGERAVREPENIVREQEIGVVVFGRAVDFDPSEDTLVRVQASQLRKRLQQYFATEGAAEPVLIEIPKGTYMPGFREREAPPSDVPPVATPTPAKPVRNLTVPLGVLCAVLVLACGLLLLRNHQLGSRLDDGQEARPTVDRLWTEMFGTRHTYVVLSDGTLTMFEDLLHHQLTPTEYQRQQFTALATEQFKDPVLLDFARKLMNRQFTPMADVGLAQRVARLNTAHAIPSDVIFARGAATQHFKSHNAILSGPTRGNPWIQLFEPRLRFRSRFEEMGAGGPYPRSFIDDVSAGPKDTPSYEVKWDRLGYCRVAYMPNLDATGSVLIVSGTDMSSTDAGAEFVTSERWVKQLLQKLDVGDGQPIPYFEALLRAQLVLGAAPSFELVAQHVLKP
jgi:hypothetical protein